VKSAKGEISATHWRFNAWAKYDNWREDHRAGGVAARLACERVIEPDLVLEGGSIDVNGAGKLLTTEECLLSDVQARNPGAGRKAIERTLREHLGATEVIWLGRGIAGDDTHGHVDDIARFASPDTVVAAVEPDRSEANHEPLKDNLARLRERGDLRIATLPMPEPIYFAGQRLPASYANFYIANRMVLVPVFGDPNDRVVLNTLARLFGDREVIGIPCRDLVLGLGTLHCMTMQEPI
jgi:agmatine deiminase